MNSVNFIISSLISSISWLIIMTDFMVLCLSAAVSSNENKMSHSFVLLDHRNVCPQAEAFMMWGSAAVLSGENHHSAACLEEDGSLQYLCLC